MILKGSCDTWHRMIRMLDSITFPKYVIITRQDPKSFYVQWHHWSAWKMLNYTFICRHIAQTKYQIISLHTTAPSLKYVDICSSLSRFLLTAYQYNSMCYYLHFGRHGLTMVISPLLTQKYGNEVIFVSAFSDHVSHWPALIDLFTQPQWQSVAVMASLFTACLTSGHGQCYHRVDMWNGGWGRHSSLHENRFTFCLTLVLLMSF